MRFGRSVKELLKWGILVRSIDWLLIDRGLRVELTAWIGPVKDIDWGVVSRLVDIFWFYSIVVLAGL
jgi:hypothetical protein